MFSHTAFGLSLRANLPIPGLEPGPDSPPDSTQVSVELGRLPAGLDFTRARPLYASPGLTVRDAGDHVLFGYEDGTRFALRADGSAVWGTWPAPLTIEDTATYLLGPVLAFVLRLRGRLALHAAVFAARAGAGAIAIAGGPQTGKSTLLAALAGRGVGVLSDDVAALVERSGRMTVSPAYPRIRLWEDSVTHLFGAPTALPPLTPNWEKRYLDAGARFCARELPLAGILVLGARTNGNAPRVEPISRRAAFVEVLAHLHSVWMLPRAPQREVFALACRLADDVPMLRVVPHEDPRRIAALCDVVLESVDRIECRNEVRDVSTV